MDTRSRRAPVVVSSAPSDHTQFFSADRLAMPSADTSVPHAIANFGPRLCVASGRDQRRALDQRRSQLANAHNARLVQRHKLDTERRPLAAADFHRDLPPQVRYPVTARRFGPTRRQRSDQTSRSVRHDGHGTTRCLSTGRSARPPYEHFAPVGRDTTDFENRPGRFSPAPSRDSSAAAFNRDRETVSVCHGSTSRSAGFRLVAGKPAIADPCLARREPRYAPCHQLTDAGARLRLSNLQNRDQLRARLRDQADPRCARDPFDLSGSSRDSSFSRATRIAAARKA